VLTGAGGTIGSAAAQQLRKLGAHVVPVDRTHGEVAAIAASVGSEGLAGDAADLADVRRLAEALLAGVEQIDVLALNAGCMSPQRVITADGNERTLQVNHLAPFLLTALLRERLVSTPGARVIVTASLGSLFGRIDLDDLELSHRRYSGIAAYCRSKLANVLFTHELARRLEGTDVTAACFHPGVIASGLLRDTRVLDVALRSPLNRVMHTPEQGAEPLVALAATAEASATNGIYFSRFAPGRLNSQGRDGGLARRLWERSEQLVGIEPSPAAAVAPNVRETAE
jgi:NAD(P)-dependent dehydrogenase (short-subunit alcohol dehydrogenase family)